MAELPEIEASKRVIEPQRKGLAIGQITAKMHIAGRKSRAQNPLIPASPRHTCPHIRGNGRKPSRNACWTGM